MKHITTTDQQQHKLSYHYCLISRNKNHHQNLYTSCSIALPNAQSSDKNTSLRSIVRKRIPTPSSSPAPRKKRRGSRHQHNQHALLLTRTKKSEEEGEATPSTITMPSTSPAPRRVRRRGRTPPAQPTCPPPPHPQQAE